MRGRSSVYENVMRLPIIAGLESCPGFFSASLRAENGGTGTIRRQVRSGRSRGSTLEQRDGQIKQLKDHYLIAWNEVEIPLRRPRARRLRCRRSSRRRRPWISLRHKPSNPARCRRNWRRHGTPFSAACNRPEKSLQPKIEQRQTALFLRNLGPLEAKARPRELIRDLLQSHRRRAGQSTSANTTRRGAPPGRRATRPCSSTATSSQLDGDAPDSALGWTLFLARGRHVNDHRIGATALCGSTW